MSDNTIKTSLIIDKELLAKVKTQALKNNQTQTEVILDYIQEGLKKNENQTKLDVERIINCNI